MWTIAGFPARAGIGTSGLVIEGEYQIRSKQDWERGLRGGEIEGNTHCCTGMLIVTKGAAGGIDSAD
jgi:hypothetical protein